MRKTMLGTSGEISTVAPMASKKGGTKMKRTTPREHEYEFALVLTGISELTPEAENALFEAGCDDATICVRSGRVSMTFSRGGASLKDTVLGAIQDVRKANIGAEALRIDACNLVTQADIARKIGRTRQLVHQYIAGIRGPGGFPAPAGNLNEGVPFWYWNEVAHWLWENDMIEEHVATDAREIALINTVLELGYHQKREPDLSGEIVRSLNRVSTITITATSRQGGPVASRNVS
jgi:hypothetical protein